MGTALLQDGGGQGHRPIAFASQKLTPMQKAWSTIEKEAFAAIWALDKFRNWNFGQHVTLYSDHNPLTYLTDVTSQILTNCQSQIYLWINSGTGILSACDTL